MRCPLCQNEHSILFSSLSAKEVYYECPCCRLVFLDRDLLIDLKAEHERYLKHNNSLTDIRYRKFLDKLAKPMLERVKSGDIGLDFGCGPIEAMREIFAESGVKVNSFDLFFYPQKEALKQQYDFLILSEVVEHFRKPREEFNDLLKVIKRGALIGVSTEILSNAQNFSSWHYRTDATHVNFFREETLIWLANYLDWAIELRLGRVTLFRAA